MSKSLEKFLGDFVWVGVEESKGTHLIKWETVTNQFDFGRIRDREYESSQPGLNGFVFLIRNYFIN